MQNIVVIDYGCGNLRSVKNALQTAGIEEKISVEITSQPEKISRADKLVLPGQGSFLDCMVQIRNLDLYSTILEGLQAKPVLAICVGLQILLQTSVETGKSDSVRGFSIIPGSVEKLYDSEGAQCDYPTQFKVPHIGWNQVSFGSTLHPVLRGIPNNSYFYFVHSYFALPVSNKFTLATTHYGLDFASVIAHDNLFATQFHPEKSSQNGLELLRNFIRWDGAT